MRINNYIKIFLLTLMAFVFALTAIAQDSKPADAPPSEAQRPDMRRFHDNRADLLHRLGLTEEQMQQIRKLHTDRKPLMDEAQKRLREATRALNEAIYADQVNNDDIQARLRDRQVAQAEVEKIRFMTELSVRRILTQEQLIRFREVRERFERVRKTIETNPQFNGNRPFVRQRRTRDINKQQTPDKQPPVSEDQQRQDL